MTKTDPTQPLRIVSKWFIIPGQEEVVYGALTNLVSTILNAPGESGTLMYYVHVPLPAAVLPAYPSNPSNAPNEIIFYEAYANADAFQAHVNGPVFAQFLTDFGSCFVQDPATGQPYRTGEFYACLEGFNRILKS